MHKSQLKCFFYLLSSNKSMELGDAEVITDSISKSESNTLILYSLKIIKGDSIIQKVILTLDYLYD